MVSYVTDMWKTDICHPQVCHLQDLQLYKNSDYSVLDFSDAVSPYSWYSSTTIKIETILKMLALPHFWKAMEFLDNYGRNKQLDQKLETTVVIVQKLPYSGGT